MRLFRTIAVAFAQYSRIPMPRFEWHDEDMTYSMSVFPWVGAVIGILFTAVYQLYIRFSIPAFAAALLMTAIPVLITGGFHIDGFMDVSDALSSYGSREDKLRILKDPHIGAFSVIRLGLLALFYIAACMIIISSRSSGALVYTVSAGFFLSRALSALAVLTFRSARKEGMLYYEAETAGKGRSANLAFSLIWAAVSSALMIFTGHITGVIAIIAAICSFGWYKYKSYKEFGGITGDTAGWFVSVCETAIICGSAVAVILIVNI